MPEAQTTPQCDHDAIRAGTAGIDAIGVQPGGGRDPDLALYNCPVCGSTIAREITDGPGTLELLREIAGAPPGGWPRLELPKEPGPITLARDSEIDGKALEAFLEAGGDLNPNGHRLIIAGDFAMTGPTAERITLTRTRDEVV